MKHLLIFAFVFTVSHAHAQEQNKPQNITKSCADIKGKTAGASTFRTGSLKNFTLVGDTKADLLKMLTSSSIAATGLTKKFEDLAKDSAKKVSKQVNDLMVPVDPKKPDGPFQIVLLLQPDLLFPGKDSLTAFISCDGNKKDVLPFALNTTAGTNTVQEPDNAKAGLPYTPVVFITPDMMQAIQNSSACNLCDSRQSTLINSKKDRVYTTDYIVTFDPMLKKDAYTICKHVFQKATGGLNERYVKVGAKWFAPAVGSQIRFEVVNQPLTDSRRITVDALDVFNNGATRFEGIINSQVTAGIVNALNPSSAAASSDSTKTDSTGGEANAFGDEDTRPPTDAEKLQMLYSQLVDYVSIFRLSSCTINEHTKNLPLIIAAVNKAFGTSAAGAVAFTQQLKSKFADSTDLTTVVDNIGNLFTLLKDLKPLAYTSLRAKNRDYLAVKTFDGNNTEISNENIRLSGGMKIDFSAGFVLTGLRDYTYALKNATVKYNPVDNPDVERDTTGNVIIKEDDGSNQVGVGILTHFYPRISSHYNIGGTVGLMTSTSFNLRLMLGGSAMISSLFGSNNRISFSGGVVWGKVKRMSVQYDDFYNHPRTVNRLPEFYSQAAAPQPIDKSEHSWFFAVTFNFGGN